MNTTTHDLHLVQENTRPGLMDWFRQLPIGKKAVLVIFLIWFAQAVPKWSAAIFASDEFSAEIMKVFITPR